MTDAIKFKPATNDGVSCLVGVETTGDVCQTTEVTRAPDSSATPTPCTTGATDTVYLYLSTGKTTVGGGHAFEQPTGPNTNVVALASPLVIAGTARSKFVVSQANKVDGSSAACGNNAPAFDFQE